jgi:hypothetical protein
MGSIIEINDTLKLTAAEGFPADLRLGARYPFRKKGRRLFHLRPTRVFLVEEIGGLWNLRGHALIDELTIDAVRDETAGIFEVSLLYPEEHRRVLNQYGAPAGKAFLK